MNSTPISTYPNCLEMRAQADNLMERVDEWKPSKTHTYTVRANCQEEPVELRVETRHTHINDDYWAVRVTHFDHLPAAVVEEFARKLDNYAIGLVADHAKCHTEFERQYMDSIVNAETELSRVPGQDDSTASTYLSKVKYDFGAFLAHRTFYNLVYVSKTNEYHEIIQLPIQEQMWSLTKPKGPETIGKYALVERLIYDADSKKLSWIMMTTLSAGGFVPNFLVNHKLCSVIAEDVPKFFDWAYNMP